MKIAKGGGSPVTLASNQRQPAGLAHDATKVYWTGIDGSVRKAALDGSGVSVPSMLRMCTGATSR
jgi:hypothetical protein